MNNIGVVRAVDKLGRLVIPKEMRELYKLNDDVEILATDEGILVRNPKYKVVEIEDKKS